MLTGMLVFKSNSVRETQGLAKNVLKKLKDKNVICLYGELGAGKTTFVQGLAKALGIRKRVISPTFLLVREYGIKSKVKSQKSKLIHVDCYRIKSEKDIKSIDLKEIWENPENLVVIEWAEKIKKILPQERIDVKFEYLDKKKRKIIIVSSNQQEKTGNW